MALMKTPGVHIVERNAFPSSVVEVATAVPAFIGHTETACHGGTSIAGRPWRIASMTEYHQCFGIGPAPLFDIELNVGSVSDADFVAGGKGYLLSQPAGKAGGRYLLYHSLLHFFQNGGGPCYIVSVGDYKTDVDGRALQAGIEQLVKEQEPTLVVVPEAVLLKQPDCIAVQQAMLSHCGRTKSRMAILDIWEGWRSQKDSHCVANFRDSLGFKDLGFGAAYYPWVNTTVVQDGDLGIENISHSCRNLLLDLLKQDLGLDRPLPATATDKQQQAQAIDAIAKNFTPSDADGLLPMATLAAADRATLNRNLKAISPLFGAILTALKRRLNLLPPSGAMAGIYTTVDNTRGVWKAPANVSMSGVKSPAVNVSSEEQEDLNVTAQGKSINAIRFFVGEGVLVWGARTLDGNSLDWRYINVRRTMIMLEESCRLAARAMVFEPNAASTWVTLKSMIENFLTGIWKRGGLAGATPEDAFSVHVGVGDTMTPEDILEGTLRVTVLVALSRPAEFIEITFQQQMQQT